MLKSVITNTTGLNIIIVSDTIHQSGKSLLNVFLQAAVENECDIHVICNENSPQKYQIHLEGRDLSYVHLYDDFSGYTDDQKSENFDNVSDLKRHRCDWVEIVHNIMPIIPSHKNKMIIIDSLSMMTLWDGVVTCYERLKKLSGIWQEKSGLQIIALFHQDAVMNGRSALQKFSHLATTVLNVCEPVREGDECPVVHITHRSSGGNVIKQIEEYKIDSSWHISSVKIKQQRNSKENVDKETNMLCNLTFKVELDEKEKEARSQLKLPYLRFKLEEETNTTTGGKIFYEADAGDDLDEEDPDDDLNI